MGREGRLIPVTTWYLEQTHPGQLRRARVPQPAPLIQREPSSPALNLSLYKSIGADWHWRDRLAWSEERWSQYLNRPEVQTWVLHEGSAAAGYVELEKQAGNDVEIAYFGIAKEFFGRGLGGHLLSVGIERAWAMGAARVWVHTCSLDHPAALGNYQARGMTIYKQETELKEVQ